MLNQTEEEYMARHMSFVLWDYLTDHVDGWRPVVSDAGETKTRQGLIVRGLISYDARERTSKPTRTFITDKGRRVMGYVLGLMADTLISHEFNIDEYAKTKPKPMEKFGYGKIGRIVEYYPKHGVCLAPTKNEP